MFNRINWLVANFYLCKHDPLGNFVISLPPRCDSLPMRKYLLRKQLHSYALQQSG